MESNLALPPYMPLHPSIAWLAFLIQLKLFQRLGRFIRISSVPDRIRQHIAASLGKTKLPTAAEYKSYDASGARKRHIEVLRGYFQVVTLNEESKEWLMDVAKSASETRELIPDIINVMLEELIRHRYELPAFETLQRIAKSAREAVNESYYKQINNELSVEGKAIIDDLFRRSEQGVSGWQLLKREPKKPTNKEIRNYLGHVDRLNKVASLLPVPNIPVVKLKYFRQVARALDASEMLDVKPSRRYALAVILIRAQFSRTLDDAGDLIIKLIQSIENSAQQQLAEYQLEQTQRVDVLIDQLKSMLEAYQT